MKRICSICARGGSRGVKNKNIRMLSGKPLIAHTIEQAIQSNLFECIAVSSDSIDILNVASEFGVKFLINRPIELASDTSAKIPAITHCITTVEARLNVEFDTIVDLDATSPLRSIKDIQESVKILENNSVSNVVTAAPARRSPYFNLIELNNENFVRLSKSSDQPIFRRQDSPKCYDMNASIYVWTRDAFFSSPNVFYSDTMLYVMPEERSIDIDSELDFDFVEFLMKKKNEFK